MDKANLKVREYLKMKKLEKMDNHEEKYREEEHHSLFSCKP